MSKQYNLIKLIKKSRIYNDRVLYINTQRDVITVFAVFFNLKFSYDFKKI